MPPYAVLGLPVCTLAPMTFFDSIPFDLEQAAMIDGCTFALSFNANPHYRTLPVGNHVQSGAPRPWPEIAAVWCAAHKRTSKAALEDSSC